MHWPSGSDRRDAAGCTGHLVVTRNAAGCTGHLVVIGEMQLYSLATISDCRTESIPGTAAGGLLDLLEYLANLPDNPRPSVKCCLW